ncbi:MAG: response regulator [Caulobacteraceae bacterium]|nr:response regulator [Caulobacteraceae bacterium]
MVEDDPAVCGALAFALRAEGYQVVTCARSGEALVLALDDPPACLVVDYLLPDMDGLALIGALRRKGVTPAAVLVTTNPDRQCRQRAAKANIPIVEKPLIGDALSVQINRLLQ